MNTKVVAKESADTNGRLTGMLSIAAAPGALLISPTMFPLLAFLIAMFGLTMASPRNRYLSILGIVLSGICGVIGAYFNTVIV